MSYIYYWLLYIAIKTMFISMQVLELFLGRNAFVNPIVHELEPKSPIFGSDGWTKHNIGLQ